VIDDLREWGIRIGCRVKQADSLAGSRPKPALRIAKDFAHGRRVKAVIYRIADPLARAISGNSRSGSGPDDPAPVDANTLGEVYIMDRPERLAIIFRDEFAPAQYDPAVPSLCH